MPGCFLDELEFPWDPTEPDFVAHPIERLFIQSHKYYIWDFLRQLRRVHQVQSPFKYIIFDLGGVIMNIDVDRALDSLVDHSGLSKSEIDWQPHLVGFFHEFEVGKISESDFRDNLRTVVGKNLGDEVLDHCWNQLLLDIPIHRLAELTALRKKYQMVMLSNTNSIHTRTIHARLQQVSGAPDFGSYFDRVYYSYQMNLAKPDPRIFEVVLEENNFQPEMTMLVDDNGDNIQSAAQMGLQVFQVNQPDDWIEFLT